MASSPPSLPFTPVPPDDGPPTALDLELEATSPRDPLLGLELGEYRIERRLGEGGMGVVYAGVQPVIHKPVAIKILQPEALGQEGEADRLIAEARAANTVRHRGIVDVFAFGKLPDGRPYIVMDLLEGEALDAVIEREAPLSVDSTLSILDDVLDTLTAAHAGGVIHRDLKPANMFLVRQPHGGSYVRILDFGLAKLSTAAAVGSRASMVAGTPHYMAPEQALGQVVGPKADLYSVGCIAYEMLTGKLPFDTEDPVQQIALRLSQDPVRASTVARVPAELDEIVMRLLARDPAARPASAAVVRQQLSKYRRNMQSESTVMGPRPQSAVQVTPVPPAAGPERSEDRITARTTPDRRRLAVGVAATGVAVLVAVIAIALLVPRGTEPPATGEIPDPQVRVVAEPPDEPAPPEAEEPKVPDRPTVARPETPPELPKRPPKAEARPEEPKKPAPKLVESARPTAEPDPVEAKRKALLAKCAQAEKKNAANKAVLGVVERVRAKARAAKTVPELKAADEELMDVVSP